MQFRQQALAKLQSPEELDLPVRFARPQGWLVLFVTVVVMAAASVWAVTGSVASTVSAPAILTHGQGSYLLQSPVSGQVTAVVAEQGQRIAANAPVLKVRTAKGETVVRSVAAGRVTGLAATIGAIISTGTNVAAVEKVADADDPLYATVYVPAENAATIPSDAAVDLTVQSAPTQQYGVLRGHVKSVDRAAQSEQQIAAFLGDSQLGEQFTKKGRPVAVLVRLDRSSATKSGYKWSSADGPPFRLSSMTTASGSIRLDDQRPVDWLLP
ncbi:HlyD family efflux transporter periplasmic adaptor subunit [Streptomyces sp. NPDC050988]|uniref:HlyD family efflux transporter periplasmic adaptor subunit n=1 Tax=Streptomyces sp. NPDC050988 TaxID=3365637 RepID=UPI0037978B6F